MIWLVGLCLGIVLVFRQTWEAFDESIRNSSDETKAFWDAKVVRGFDGNDHLVSIPTHLKIAACLICSLLAAVFSVGFARFVWGL